MIKIQYTEHWSVEVVIMAALNLPRVNETMFAVMSYFADLINVVQNGVLIQFI